MKTASAFSALCMFFPAVVLAGPINISITDMWSSGGGNNYGQAQIVISTPASSLSYTLPTTEFLQFGTINVAPAFGASGSQIVPSSENYTLAIPLGQTRNLNEALRLNGNSLTLSQHSLILNLQIGPWTGGALVSQPPDPNGRPDYLYSITGGTVTSLTGTIQLRDSSGNCLFCETIVSGGGTISSSSQLIFPTTSASNSYSLSGLTDASSAVPEPSSMALAGIGLALAVAWKRRR